MSSDRFRNLLVENWVSEAGKSRPSGVADDDDRVRGCSQSAQE